MVLEEDMVYTQKLVIGYLFAKINPKTRVSHYLSLFNMCR